MSMAADMADPSAMRPGLRVQASLEVLAQVRAYVRSAAGRLGADRRTVSALTQCVDEWVTNVVVHGYRGAAGPVEVAVRREGDDIVVQVRDAAPAFDPATAPPFHRDLPLAERPFGGMGIALIKDLCDALEHRALPVGNEITLRRPAQTPEHHGGRP